MRFALFRPPSQVMMMKGAKKSPEDEAEKTVERTEGLLLIRLVVWPGQTVARIA